MSNCTSCKSSDKTWGITCPATNTLHRITFSKGIADFLVRKFGDMYKATRFSYKLGRPLEPGEESCNGLYAIVGTKKDLVLRISLTKEAAEFMTKDESRHIAEIYLNQA